MMRHWSNALFFLITGACTFVGLGLLLAILAAITFKGLSSLSWDFLFKPMKEAGASGGVFYNIIGTVILIGTALIVSSPLAFALALLQQVYLKKRSLRRALTLFLYLINGIPSILFGLFGLTVFVQFFDWGKSWLTGGIVLGLMILPTMAVAISERIHAIPQAYFETAAGLGLRPAQIVWSIFIPYSLNGWLSGSLLGLARAAGETAPIMFTATVFSGATVPDGVQESPVLSLPYHIFILAQESYNPQMIPNLWASAFVLVAMVMVLSLFSLPWRKRAFEAKR